MDDDLKKKALAIGKVAFGAARIAGGISTGFGLGLLGVTLHAHGLEGLAHKLATNSCLAGKEIIENGLDEFKSI